MRFVLPSLFDVFQAHPPSQDIVSDVEHMIALVVGQMYLQELEMFIDVFDQSQALHHQMHGSDSPAVDRLDSLGHLVVNVTGFEHRTGLLFPMFCRQSSLDSMLAIPENLRVVSFHSKWPFVGCLLS